MLDYADAFCLLRTFSIANNSPNRTFSVQLKRPFAQICVLSRELDSDLVKGSYPDYPYACVGFTKTGDNGTLYLPTTWNFTKYTTTMESINVSTKPNTWVTNPNKSRLIGTSSEKAPTVTYQGKEYKYLYMGYVFANKDTTNPVNEWAMDFYTDAGNTRCTYYRSSGNTPNLRANTRVLFVSDADGTTAEGSLLIGNASFTVTKTTTFDSESKQEW